VNHQDGSQQQEIRIPGKSHLGNILDNQTQRPNDSMGIAISLVYGAT
jgi:hypothetical protein